MTSEGARSVTLLLGLLLASSAFAERGLFTLSLQSGQVVSVTPTPGSDRVVPLLATLTYGLSERWSIAASANFEFEPGGATAAIILGPRVNLLKTFTVAVEALLAPEAVWVPAARRFDLAVRAGFSLRYLLAWGVGVVVEAGARGRAHSSGPFAPTMQGYLVGGLFIEA